MLDAATTIFIVLWGGSETNPVMSALLGEGYVAFVLGKLVLTMGVGVGAYFVSTRASGYFLLTAAVALVGTYIGVFSNVIAIGVHIL